MSDDEDIDEGDASEASRGHASSICSSLSLAHSSMSVAAMVSNSV